MDADAVVGAGLAGLVATAELADAGKKVVLVEQEPQQSFGGQAFWSLGGLFMVGTPQQRWMGVRDTHELAWQDWLGSAGFDRDEDRSPRQWAEAYVDFACGEKRTWLRGVASSRVEVGDFELRAPAVIVTSGGIGGDHELVRKVWPERLGTPPQHMVAGVPAHVDGRMLMITERSGGRIINPDRMWHYTEGLHNWNPVWENHGIRILPGPSSLWIDARGRRLPPPLFPGFDSLGTLKHIGRSGYEHTWFVLTQKIVEKEFALSGSEQNPDMTSKSVRQVLARGRSGAPAPVAAFVEHGEDFVVADDLAGLVRGMNELVGEPLIDLAELERVVVARDREIENPFSKDAQVTAIRTARRYRGDRLSRVVKPHRLLDPKAGPLIAVRLSILTRKTLGGLEADLSGRVLQTGGEPLAGVYAAGEVAGFGGGGMHGYNALEGTFLGGCLFSGRVAGRAAAAAVG